MKFKEGDTVIFMPDIKGYAPKIELLIMQVSPTSYTYVIKGDQRMKHVCQQKNIDPVCRKKTPLDELL